MHFILNISLTTALFRFGLHFRGGYKMLIQPFTEQDIKSQGVDLLPSKKFLN